MTKSTYTRRQMLQLSATAATALSTGLTFASEQAPNPPHKKTSTLNSSKTGATAS